jgi:glycerol-3-phosphate dehydrogenase
MLARRDHRVMFAIPWGDRTVLGTTDTDFRGALDHVFADSDDIDYLLETANHYFPEAALRPTDVLATWAGLRPLIAPAPGVAESDTSREHEIYERPGFLTIAGGKLTTYRRMALEVVDRAGAQLGKIPKSTTEARPLPGAEGVGGDEDLERLAAWLVETYRSGGVTEDVARHLALTYGARAPRVAARITADATSAERLEPELPYLFAEIDEAVDVELARQLPDVLERRVPLLLRSRDQGLGVARKAAERIAPRLGWNAARVQEEIDRYQAVVDETRRFRR